MANDVTATMGVDARDFNKGVDKAFGRVNNARLEPRLSLGKINADFTKFQDSLDSATARVIAFTATTSLIYGVGNAFTRLTQDAIKIESVMTRIQSIFGKTDSEMKSFQASIFDLANGVGLSFYQVAEAAEEFSRQGLSLNKTLEATRAAAIVAKLSGAELKGVIEGLTATLSTFNDGTLDYIQVANKLVALDSAFATSAAGITEGLKRVAGVAAEAGLSFDQTAAAITALKQVTGRSEAVIGNSLKSIFTSLQTEKVQKDLATLGVETKDASGEFRNLIDVLSDLSKVYQTLGDAQKAVIAQKIGKTYQANAFQGILRTFETGEYEKAIGISENAGSNAEDRIEKLNKTTEAALTRFGNNITKLGSTLGDKLGKPLVETVAGYFNSLVDIANTTFGDSKIGDYLINGLKTTLEGPGVAIIAIALGKLLARITRETAQAVKSVAGISGRKENILEIEKFITQNLTDQNIKELEKVKYLDTVAAKQKAILSIMQEQLAVAEKNRFASPLQQQFGVNLANLDATKARKVAKKIPNRAIGDPAMNKAMIREAIDIKNGVGGARSTAIPQVKTLNLGRGPEKVVVNSDEKIVPNFAGSGQHAILNRKMMGYAIGKLPARGRLPLDGYMKINRGESPSSFLEFQLDKKNKVISLGHIQSDTKGDAYKNFKAIAEFAGRSGFTIQSGHFTNQAISRGRSVSGEGHDLLMKTFPQLRYREGLSSITYGEYKIDKKDPSGFTFPRNFTSIYDLKSQASKLSKDDISRLVFGKVEDQVLDLKYGPGKRKRGLGFSRGFIPNLASGYENLSPEELDKLSKNILRQVKSNITKAKNLGIEGPSLPIISNLSPLTSKLRGLENYQTIPTANTYDFSKNEFLKSAFLDFASQNKYSFAGSGNTANLRAKGSRRIISNFDISKAYKPKSFTQSFSQTDILRSLLPIPNIQQAPQPPLGGVIGGGVVPPGVILPQFIGASSVLPPSSKRYQRGNYDTGFGAFYRNDPRFIIGASSSVRPDTKQRLLAERAARLQKQKEDKRLGRTGFKEFDRGDERSFVTGIPNTIYGGGASSRVFYDYAQENRYAVKDNVRNAGAVVRPIGQNFTSSDFSPVSVQGLPPRIISGIGVSRENIPEKLTPQMIKALISLGYDKDDIKKMGVREAFNILNPGSDFSKAPIGSSSLGGVAATKIQVTQPLPNRGGEISASLTGGGGGGLTFSDVRAGAPIISQRDAFIKQLQEEGALARARAERISSSIGKGAILTGSAKKFISSNRDLFSEEILQKYDSKKSFKNRFSGALSGFGDRALGAGLALSFVGGAVAQGYKTKEGEETQTSRAIGGISQSIGLGSTAGIFGAKAGVAGLVIGALAGLNTALGENVDSLNGLSKSHENLQKKYSDESAAVNTYRENFISLSDAISSGSERAAKEARKNITTALSQIQDASFINKLSAAGTPQELSRVIDSLGSQRSRELAGSEAISYAAKLRQDNRRNFIEGFQGRNYSPGASSSELGDIIANSIDFSKLPKDFGIADLPKDAQEAIRIFSTGFKGTEIILKRIQDRANSVKGSEKAVDKINKVIAQAQDFSSTISASAQAANFKIFEKQLQNSLTNSLASINLESSKPFISESSFAKGQFSLDQNARNQKYLSDVSSVNSSILAKSQEILSGKTLTFNQLSKTQSSFSQFGEDQNIERFIKNISGVLGADSKELIKFSQEQFLELKKLNSEVSAANQEASARQRALLDEIKRNSLLKLFGGGVNRYDKTQVLPGLSAALRGPVLNKYENKGFGINPITRAPTYTPKEYSLEQGRVLDSNRLTAEQGIQRARYLYDNGYFGADDPSASPELKVLRESRLNEERKRLSGFFKTTLSANARDDTFFQSGEYINRINQDAINFSGSNIFGAKEKSDLAALLKSGDSKDVASARDYVTKIVKESGLLGQYSANSKGRESQNINDFIGFLGNRAEEVKYISESADLQAKSLLPGQTEAQKQVDLLTNIKTQEELANQNLSTIASLIASQDARIQSEKRASEYNIARSEYDKLQVKYEDDSQKFGSLISRYNEMTGIKRQFSGIGEFRNALQGSFRATKDAGGDADSIYSLIKEARTIQSTDEFLIKRSELKNIIDNNFKDVQTQTLEKLGESLKSTFDAAISKLESFVSGKGSSSEVSLNIDATVTGSDLYASDDFKSQLKDFVVSYTNQKIKENLLPGRVFIDRPTTMVA